VIAGIGLSNKSTNTVVREDGMVPHMIVDRTRHDIVGLEILQDFPSRKRIEVQVDSLDSFMEYLEEQKKDETRIFARVSEKPPKLTVTAAIDYHGTEREAASWITHTVQFAPRTSDDWDEWTENNNTSFDQAEFALFLEDNQRNISRPDGATLLEIASTLEATREVQFRSSVRLDNGDRGFKMDEQTKAQAGITGELAVPTEIEIYIPVFEGSPREVISAKLRHSLNASTGKLTFRYRMDRPTDIIKAAAEQLLVGLRDNTGVPVFNGTYRKAAAERLLMGLRDNTDVGVIK